MKKGFTLVELLAVIVIVALLAVVTITNSTKLFENSKQKAYDLMIQDIVNASKEYLKLHKDILENLTPSSPSDTIYLNDLAIEFLIKEPVINPLTGEVLPSDTTSIDIRLEINGDISYTVNIP